MLSSPRPGAPIGSCLIGSKEFIARAHRFRKGFGGGMRITGILVACAAFALTHNFSKLAPVHDLARKLESGLLELGVEITGRAETCMVRLVHSWDSDLFTTRETRSSIILLLLELVMPKSMSVPRAYPSLCTLQGRA